MQGCSCPIVMVVARRVLQGVRLAWAPLLRRSVLRRAGAALQVDNMRVRLEDALERAARRSTIKFSFSSSFQLAARDS